MAAVGAPPPVAVAAVLPIISAKVGLLRAPPGASHSFTSPFVAPLPLRPSLSVVRRPPPRVLSVGVGEEKMAVAWEKPEQKAEGSLGVVVGGGRVSEFKVRVRPCELYICNLPRSCDISQLLDMFKPFGTVCSVEVSRDAQTGLSRGCGYVTMSAVQEAREAIAALDKSDLGGREVRVRFLADMSTGRRNSGARFTAPKKDLVFESPHKVYVGNLAWSVTPEILRDHFSQFGTVVSARLVYDRKGGKNRVYGFVSFSSYDEVKAALEFNGSELCERIILVKEVFNRE